MSLANLYTSILYLEQNFREKKNVSTEKYVKSKTDIKNKKSITKRPICAIPESKVSLSRISR